MKIMDGEDIWRQVIQFVEEERWGGEFTRDEEYYKVFDSLNKKEEYIKRSDYIPVTYLIQKFIADEEYHISLCCRFLRH